MSMNIPLIRESFAAIKPHAKEVVEHFYDELFSKNPEAKRIFKGVKFDKQHVALATALSHAVDYLEDGEHLTDYFTKMGERHAGYGVKKEHFPLVAQALLATLAFYFEGNWTSELEAQWTGVIQFAAGAMIQGMEKTEAAHSAVTDLESLARSYAHELFKKTLEEELQGELSRLAKDKVKDFFRKCIEQEAKELLGTVKKRAA
ncbi:MAG: globin domain-containing protein [Bdellovibrionota bacterium]